MRKSLQNLSFLQEINNNECQYRKILAPRAGFHFLGLCYSICLNGLFIYRYRAPKHAPKSIRSFSGFEIVTEVSSSINKFYVCVNLTAVILQVILILTDRSFCTTVDENYITYSGYIKQLNAVVNKRFAYADI